MEQTVAAPILSTSAPLPSTDAYRAALRRLRPGFLAAAAFSAVISLLMLTGSIYMLQVYDRVLASGSVPTLMGLFAIVVVLFLFLGFYDFLRMRLLSRLALRLDADLGAPAFGRWLQSGVAGQAGTDAAPLRDLDTVRAAIAGPAMTALFDLPWVPLYLGVLFILHPWLGWLTVGGAGIVAVLAWVGHRLTQGTLAQSMTEEAAVRDFSDKGRRNAEMIFAMGMTGHITARWRQLQGLMLTSTQKAGDPAEMLAAASRSFRMLMQSAMLTLGAFLVIRGEISGGMIIASSILSGRALGPIDQVIGQWRTVGRGLAAHRRLCSAFANETQIAATVALPAPTGRITVSNLIKRPAGQSGARNEALILDNVSFALEPGDGLGVIGTSASGKSTLARLLVGAWAVDGGEIRLDGATPDQWIPEDLGRHIGYLPQQIDLLPGTIRDNIARFDPTITDEAVMAAAQMAGVHAMILRLPQGYGTRAGLANETVPLSGGQVQRIGLARALCGSPKIVVLDEPNSNLDAAGDAALTDALTALRKAGASVVVMAHRPSALLAMNKLLVLDAGKVAHFGPKSEVLAALQKLGEAQADPVADPQPTMPAVSTADATDAPVIEHAVASNSTDTPVSNMADAPLVLIPTLQSFGKGRRPGASPERLSRLRMVRDRAGVASFRKEIS